METNVVCMFKSRNDCVWISVPTDRCGVLLAQDLAKASNRPPVDITILVRTRSRTSRSAACVCPRRRPRQHHAHPVRRYSVSFSTTGPRPTACRIPPPFSRSAQVLKMCSGTHDWTLRPAHHPLPCQMLRGFPRGWHFGRNSGSREPSRWGGPIALTTVGTVSKKD